MTMIHFQHFAHCDWIGSERSRAPNQSSINLAHATPNHNVPVVQRLVSACPGHAYLTVQTPPTGAVSPTGLQQHERNNQHASQHLGVDDVVHACSLTRRPNLQSCENSYSLRRDKFGLSGKFGLPGLDLARAAFPSTSGRRWKETRHLQF